MPALITNIQNKGYVERMKKAYSLIQNVTTQIVNEEGEPSNWIFDAYSMGTDEPNQHVVDMYAEHMNYLKNCGKSAWLENPCILTKNKYLELNGTTVRDYMSVYWAGYPLALADGSVVALKFLSNPSGGYFWGNPDLMFIVDVNGKQKPNKIGRDIFYFYLDKRENGKVHPYGFGQEDDCNKDGEGYTCAYKIITEGNMNY